MKAKQLAEKIEQILDEKKGLDIEVLHVAEKTVLAEYFVVVSGTSTTHVKALAEEVEYELKKNFDIRAGHVEGADSARWILLDYRDVIVHVFHPQERQEYSLERLWQMKHPDTMIQ